MQEYESKSEIIQGILIGINELRGYKIGVRQEYGDPYYLESLPENEIKTIYNQISNKLRETENKKK